MDGTSSQEWTVAAAVDPGVVPVVPGHHPSSQIPTFLSRGHLLIEHSKTFSDNDYRSFGSYK